MDRQRLISVAAVVIFLHAACGLLRFLTAEAVALAIDYAACLALLVSFVLYARQNRPRLSGHVEWKGEKGLLLFMFVWLILSCIANLLFVGPKNVYYAPNALIDAALLFFVYFPFGRLIAREGASGLTVKLLCLLLTLWSLFILAVLVFVFMGRVMVLPGGVRLGVYEDYNALALNNNPNSTSCIEYVFLMSCALAALSTKRKAFRLVCIVFMLIHFTALVISGSRAYFLAALVAFGLTGFGAAWRRFDQRKTAARLGIALLAAVCTVFALLLLRYAVDYLFGLVGSEKPLIPTDKRLSGRTDIWIRSVKSIFHSALRYLFGVGAANSHAAMAEYGHVHLYTHNQFLEIGVCAGVPCMAAFACLCWMLAKKGAWITLKQAFSLRRVLAVAFFASLLIANLAEAHLLFYRRPPSYAFFLLAGWIYEICLSARASAEDQT